MLNYDIEPLFERVYEIRNKYGNRKLYFISNWDNHLPTGSFGIRVLVPSFADALKSVDTYRFAYEQFELKRKILSFLNESAGIKWRAENISLSPGATQSIAMAVSAMRKLGKRRFLLFTPAYFSTYNALINNDVHLSYYHLDDSNNFRINFSELKAFIQEQFIDTLVLTDPIYGSGVDFTYSDYSNISSICAELNVGLVIDHSLGGMRLDGSSNIFADKKKLTALKSITNYAFIDSITKRLSINGSKFSLIFGDEGVIDMIDKIAESYYGGLSTLQCSIISNIYSNHTTSHSTERYKSLIGIVNSNRRIIDSMVRGTQFELGESDTGYFAVLKHKHYQLKDIDGAKASLYLLNYRDTIAISIDRFSYFETNRFGLRVNLCQSKEDLLFGISQSIGINYKRFHK